MGYYILVAILGVIAGGAGVFFLLRRNREYFNIEDILRLERDKLAAMGKDKLAELKKKIDEVL